MPLRPGTVFAGFTIVRLLGAEGMGEVYVAEHPRLPRSEALRILPGELSGEAEFRARFYREADLAAALSHPHIVDVHERGECDGRLWLSMGYVEGSNVARLLQQHFPGGMARAEAAAIITAVAEALDYAHDLGLLHHNVNPANILLTAPGSGPRRILLADFGIARRINDTSGPVDGRSDQYSLACTAYQLICGAARLRHSGPTVVINSPPPRIGDTRPELADLDGALLRAMAKDPAERFARCQDFAAALSGDARTRP